MYPRKFEIDVLTAADGSFTGYTNEPVSGEILSLAYVKDGSNPFDNGSTMTLTSEESAQAIWAESNVNASATRAPRQATHSTVGAAALYAAAGTAVNDRIPVAQERLKLVVASGGNAKNGKLIIWVG